MSKSVYDTLKDSANKAYHSTIEGLDKIEKFAKKGEDEKQKVALATGTALGVALTAGTFALGGSVLIGAGAVALAYKIIKK